MPDVFSTRLAPGSAILASEAPPEAALDEHLNELADAVSRRPNPVSLILRLVVWLFPTLVAAGLIVDRLYSGLRSPLFVTLVVAGGGLAGTGWIVWRLLRSHKRVQAARSKVLEVLTRRQEGILAGNAAASVNLDVQPVLRDVAEQVLEVTLSSHTGRLEAASSQLDEWGPEASETLLVAPVLTERRELQAFEDSLDMASDMLLEEALEHGLLAVGLIDEELPGALVKWTRERVETTVSERRVDFKDLWAIHMSSAGGQPLSALMPRLNKLATPLVPPTWLPDSREGTSATYLAPIELHSELADIVVDTGIRSDPAVDLEKVHSLGCLRLTPVRIRSSEAGA